MSRHSLQRFFAELKRRRVFRVMAVYGAVAFVIMQVVDIMIPGLGLPGWTMPLVLVLLLAGFPVAIVLAWAFETTPHGMQRTEAADEGEIDAILTAPAGKRWPLGLAALGGVVLLALGTWWVTRPSAVEDRAYDSIAVLPFVNMSGEEEYEYLADGLAEQLLHALANVEGLNVASRTSAFAFKESAADARTIGDSLNVRTVLEGSVRGSRDRLRVTAQLIDAEDGYHLWSEEFDRDRGDLLRLQDDLTEKIVRALAPRLAQAGASDGLAAELRGTEDAAAYDLFLRGRYFWNKRSGEDMAVAISLFEQAIAEDSTFAPAYAAIADASAVPTGWGDDTGAALDRAEKYARRALAIDPALAQAHAALAYTILVRDLDFETAERSFRRAIELDPNYATAHQWYAELLVGAGRDEEAIREVRRAESLDPTMIIRWNVARILYFAGRYDEALEQLDRMAGEDASRSSAGGRLQLLSLVGLGDYESIVALTGRYAMGGEREIRDSVEAAGQDMSGPRIRLMFARTLEGAEDGSGQGPNTDPFVLAAWMAVEPDTVWHRLMTLAEDTADADHRFTWFHVLADAAFDPLRDDPGFDELNRRFGVRMAPR